METLTNDDIDAKVKSGPTVLDFYQASCAPCRVLAPRLEQIAREYKERVAAYRIDIEQDPAGAKRFAVTSLPTVLFFNEGKEVGRLDGLITERDLKGAFDRVAKPAPTE